MKEICNAEQSFMVEVYNNKWGQAVCFQSKIQDLYLQYMDKLKFYKACSDDIKLFHEHCQSTKPVFYVFSAGKPMGNPIVGILGPTIDATVKEAADKLDM